MRKALAEAEGTDGFRCTALGSLVIAVFDRASNGQTAEAMGRVLAQTARANPTLAVLTVVGPQCGVPDSSVRNRLTNEVKSVQKQMVAAVTVIEGSGFRTAAVRAAVTGMTLLLKVSSYPAKTFATVAEGGDFLAGIVAIGADDITDMVKQLRAVRSTRDA
ncbi:MAG TPA: hypothetical protein VIA18_14690 [Polyangia bacterium]|jgi:hypothetical protein|nr:hypothetical protein [Polyangia bacterium]